MSETDDSQFDDDYFEPWCKDLDGHTAVHRFCVDHQAAWCLICEGGCDQCVDDPHCPECHAALTEEYHDWDCSYGDE